MSNRIFFLSTLFFLFTNGINAQNSLLITGVVKSNDGLGLSNATISVFGNHTDTIRTITKQNGLYSINIKDHSKFTIRVSYVGFEDFVKSYDISDKATQSVLEDVILRPASGMMSNITLESQKIQIKEDTVSYKVDSTMYRKNDNVETLLKNLPGVQVDKDGTVTAQGKQVTRVKVNGKEFFNGDVTTATRELNADMVDRIQIIDDYGDQAAFTGIKDGDPTKTLNIELKKDKNKGYFGNVSAGIGTEQRYLGSLSMNKFNDAQQISLISNVNNTNASLFNFGSVGGSMGNMMNTMAKSMGIGRGGAGVGTLIGNLGNNDGINTLKSIGLNYRDQWGARIDVYGSYSFTSKISEVNKESLQENTNENTVSDYYQNIANKAVTSNHRISFNLEYKIDSANYLKINPSVSYNNTYSNYVSDFSNIIKGKTVSEGNMFDTSGSKSPNFNGSVLFNHRFAKRGRTISFNVNYGTSTSATDETYDNVSNTYFPIKELAKRQTQQIIQDNPNNSYGIKVSYTEPLSKKRSLELNYAYNYQKIANSRETYNIDTLTGAVQLIDLSSNQYENIYKTHRIGLNVKTNEKKYNYTIGISAQPANISTSYISPVKPFVTRNLINYYPVIRLAYNFSRSRSLNLNYNGSSSQPSITQLQEVPDSSNPQFITIGNSELKPEFTNTFSMRYNNFDFISGNVFFSNISVSFTQDKIVSNVKTTKKNIQETRYLNSNGYFTIFGFYNISKPVQNRKYVFNLGGNVAYNNNIAYVTDVLEQQHENIGKNWVIGQRFSTDFKVKKWLETTVSANFSLNNSVYSYQKELNANTRTWTFSNSSRFFLPLDFIISYEADKTINEGLADNISTNTFIVNATIEKQFLPSKTLSVKIQGFDLFNENVGVSRSVSSTGFTDTRTNRLGRYYMVSLIWRLNKFFGDTKGSGMMDLPSMHGGSQMRMMRGSGPGF